LRLESHPSKHDPPIKKEAQVLLPALFVSFREPITVLTEYEQNHEQGGDQNDVRRSVHVVQNAIDFIHLCLLGWCKNWEHCGVIRPRLK
jgi:hypothetical protein